MIYQRRTPLDAAVTHMTKAAQSEGRNNLVMTADEWKKLVLSGVRGGVREFGMEIVNRVSRGESIDIVNRWLALAMDIWNAMPEM